MDKRSNPTYRKCKGTSKRSGLPCEARAVDGSDYCYHHGGASKVGAALPQYKHGRYSKYIDPKFQSKIEDLDQFELLDLADELQAQRMLIAEYMGRFQNGYPLQEQNIGAIISWLNSIGVMVERMMKIRNETALTGAEIAHLKMRTAELVTKYIDDPEKRRQFVIELFQVEQPALSE